MGVPCPAVYSVSAPHSMLAVGQHHSTQFSGKKTEAQRGGGLLATPTGVSRVHCCLNSYEAPAGGCMKYKRVRGGCPNFSAHGCRDLSGGLASHPAGHWNKGEAQWAGPGRWAARQMHPTSSTHASPACSQPGGHGLDVPAVLRALHRSALPAARLGAGRLHVQVPQLHPAGAWAGGKRAGGSGTRARGRSRCGRGARGRSRCDLLLGVEVGGAGTESGGGWVGLEQVKPGLGGREEDGGQWGLGGEWGGGRSEPCYFLPHPSRDPRMHLPLLVSVLGASAYP